MVVVTGKGGCDLCPVGVHLRLDGWIDIGRNVAIQPAAVPVIVDYDIHSRGDSPVNHLFDLRHVSGIDLVIGLVGTLTTPSPNDTIPLIVFCAYQMMFAIITPAL